MSATRKGKPAPWKHRPTKEVNGVLHYRCSDCQQFLPREGFHANKRTVLGIKTQCKACHNACSLRSRDKDNKRLKAVEYEASRRARKAGSGGTVTQFDWRKLTDILGFACLACGSTDHPTQDHIVPLAKGGQHHPLNLQPLCRPCNERKQASSVDYRTPEQRAAVMVVWVVEFRRITC
jgi:5-methylcytosine-specific restriction endonuclease McrA